MNSVLSFSQGVFRHRIIVGRKLKLLCAGLLFSSLLWAVQVAIEDEAFLLFLADSVEDNESETGLTDPLHMIEHVMEPSVEGRSEREQPAQTTQPTSPNEEKGATYE